MCLFRSERLCEREDLQFTINGIWVHARKFSGGMLSVNCTYNPVIITMLKQWRNKGGERYNNKYKYWNYWQPFLETIPGTTASNAFYRKMIRTIWLWRSYTKIL